MFAGDTFIKRCLISSVNSIKVPPVKGLYLCLYCSVRASGLIVFIITILREDLKRKKLVSLLKILIMKRNKDIISTMI